jgi:hypothetical protein
MSAPSTTFSEMRDLSPSGKGIGASGEINFACMMELPAQ